MYAEFAGDPVIQSLAFEDQRHYVVILCLKCDGVLDRKISKEARNRIINRALGLDSVAAGEVKRRLIETRLVTETWQPTGWNNRQYQSDKSTERVRKHRKNKDQGNVTETPKERSGNAPDTDTDTDTEKRKEKGFSPPSVAEVAAYCDERKNGINPALFVDHYQTNGWMRGKSKVKDWRACVRTWEKDTKPADKAFDPRDYV
jgi:hypothetical protein